MEFTDYCIIAEDVVRLAEFYMDLLNVEIELDPIHMVVSGAGLNIVIYDKKAAESDGYDFGGAGVGMTFIGFNVDDVDAEYERVGKIKSVNIISKPKLWPWGAKSFRFSDPEGNKIVFRSWARKVEVNK